MMHGLSRQGTLVKLGFVALLIPATYGAFALATRGHLVWAGVLLGSALCAGLVLAVVVIRKVPDTA